jgi:hypothetical protein
VFRAFRPDRIAMQASITGLLDQRIGILQHASDVFLDFQYVGEGILNVFGQAGHDLLLGNNNKSVLV